MSENETPPAEPSSDPQLLEWIKKHRIVLGGMVGIVIMLAIAIQNITVYTVQPIGFVPEGKTIIIVRERDGHLFESADGFCLRKLGYVSLLCRGFALGELKDATIIARLPYQEWAYHLSTGGADFNQ